VIVIGAVWAVLAAATAEAAELQSSQALTARAACPGAASTSPGVRHEAALRCLVNWARARHGRQPVAASSALARSARRKALAVIRCRAFSHTPCGKPRSLRLRVDGFAVGEDLYLGEGAAGSPLAAVAGWLHSPRHRAVLLGRSFAHVGVAYLPDARVAGMQGASLAVLQLGAPL
jgi:uncharacterized protein YkwD